MGRKNQHKGREMVERLFDYIEGVDPISDLRFNFYGVTLKVPIGPHEAGETFDVAFVDFDDGVLALYVGNQEVYRCDLELRTL